MKEAPFAILHDGIVQSISGQVPGLVSLTIRCAYLRRRHHACGESFILLLKKCSKISFTSEGGETTEDFQRIVEQRPEMLSADTIDGTVAVYCSGGTLELKFDTCEIFLNDTETLSVDELEHLARSFWDENCAL